MREKEYLEQLVRLWEENCPENILSLNIGTVLGLVNVRDNFK